MSNINKLGNGIGLIYIEDLDGNVASSIPNNSLGARQAKQHALVSSPVGYTISAQGSVQFVSIGSNQNITSLQIDTVEQFDITSPIAVSIGAEADAATALANAINAYVPTSGPNYKAEAIGDTVFLQAPASSGADVNGDAVVLTIGAPPDHTIVINNIDGGSTGDELISTVTGYKYYLNPTANAVEGDVASIGTEEISRYIINRGTHQQIPSVTQQVAGEGLTDLERYSQLQVLEVDASGATDLKTINGDFAIHDIIILKNTSAFTITLQDVVSGNLRMDPDSFAMINDDYVIWFQYVNDPVDGLVWREIYRKPTTLGVDSVTDIELSDNAVDTLALQNLSVTTAKIALGAITNALMATDSVDTINILNDAVTTPKIIDLAVTAAKLAVNSVTTDKINALAVTEPKIADGAVSLDKVVAALKTDRIVVPVSFETGELGTIKVKMPACTVTDIYVSIAKDIENSDDATVVPKDHVGGIMADGTVDLPAGAPIGNDNSSTPTANNTFADGEYMWLETLKATPGGKAVVTICYTLT